MFACYFEQLTTRIDEAFSNCLIVMNDKLESLNVQTNFHWGGLILASETKSQIRSQHTVSKRPNRGDTP